MLLTDFVQTLRSITGAGAAQKKGSVGDIVESTQVKVDTEGEQHEHDLAGGCDGV